MDGVSACGRRAVTHGLLCTGWDRSGAAYDILLRRQHGAVLSTRLPGYNTAVQRPGYSTVQHCLLQGSSTLGQGDQGTGETCHVPVSRANRPRAASARNKRHKAKTLIKRILLIWATNLGHATCGEGQPGHLGTALHCTGHPHTFPFLWAGGVRLTVLYVYELSGIYPSRR